MKKWTSLLLIQIGCIKKTLRRLGKQQHLTSAYWRMARDNDRMLLQRWVKNSKCQIVVNVLLIPERFFFFFVYSKKNL